MQVTLCDWRTEKGEPCGERALITGNYRLEGTTYEFDLCEVHAKSLTATAREAVATSQRAVTRLPRAEPSKGRKLVEQLVDKIDYPDLRAWLVEQGKIKPEAKGRISREHQQAWVDAGEPRPR